MTAIYGLQQLGTDQPLHVAPYALSASRNLMNLSLLNWVKALAHKQAHRA